MSQIYKRMFVEINIFLSTPLFAVSYTHLRAHET